MPLFFCALKGTWKQRQRRCTGKGGYSLSRKRIAPFKSPKRKVLTLSYYPLLRSRWQLCCLTDAAHPLRVPLC